MGLLEPEQRHRILVALGVVDREFNPSLHLHDPHTGKWMDMPDVDVGLGRFDDAVKEAAEGQDADDLTHISPSVASVIDALTTYQGGSGSTNRALRQAGGGPPDDGRASRVTAGLDAALAGRELERDIVVRRAVANPKVTFDGHDPTPGMTWRDHAFVSTTSSEGSPAFAGSDGIEMRILVPKGTRAISTEHLDQYEILLERGLTFRVVRDNGISPYGIRDIDVEVVR